MPAHTHESSSTIKIIAGVAMVAGIAGLAFSGRNMRAVSAAARNVTRDYGKVSKTSGKPVPPVTKKTKEDDFDSRM